MERELDVCALGKKVKQYRVMKGYSAEKLSEQAGVSKSHITNIESGNAHASAEVLVRIANALEVSIDLLLCDSLKGKTAQKARMLEYANFLETSSEGETKIIMQTVTALQNSLHEFLK